MENSDQVINSKSLVPSFILLCSDLTVMTGCWACLEQAFYTGPFKGVMLLGV